MGEVGCAPMGRPFFLPALTSDLLRNGSFPPNPAEETDPSLQRFGSEHMAVLFD